jgi:SNW domain-containing protein 1
MILMFESGAPYPSCWNTGTKSLTLAHIALTRNRAALQVVINDKFAQFAEALVMAQEVAREGITARIKERERQQRIEKDKKDEELRQLARDARMMRTGAIPASSLGGGGGGAEDADGGGAGDGNRMERDERKRSESPAPSASMPDTFERESREEREARRQRDEIREERRRERERERRLEELEKRGVKKSKVTRYADVLALYVHVMSSAFLSRVCFFSSK